MADGELIPETDLTPDFSADENARGAKDGTDKNDKLSGSKGDDTLVGEGGDDQLKGKAGDDFLFGGAGNDKLEGNAGDDVLVGGDGNDELKGGSGQNVIYGGLGDDVLTGGNDDDVLSGGAGDDLLKGGKGDDLYIIDRGEGMGHDTIVDSGSGNILDFRDSTDDGAAFDEIVFHDNEDGTWTAAFPTRQAPSPSIPRSSPNSGSLTGWAIRVQC